MSDPIWVMADELIEHHTLPGGTCRCGHFFTPGSSIAHHRALAAYTAMTLDSLGIAHETRHEAVMSTMRLTRQLKEPKEND